VSDAAARLRRTVTDPLKAAFVGRDEVIDLIALAVVAGEHLFLYGPPGTAKSLLVRRFATAVEGRYFEYLLTRFSEPTELFGPIDLAKLREGTVATVITGMLPEAEFAFLDELFNANSAILNNLLTVLNERVFRRGAETHHLPLLTAFAASNHLPEDDALQALFDRFLLRCAVPSLPAAQLPALLAAGWAIERQPSRGNEHPDDAVSADDLRQMAVAATKVDLSAILADYADAAMKVRDLGVALSDRRAVKVLKLVAASAVLCGRPAADHSDLWVLRYVWDRAEQIGPLTSLVAALIDRGGSTAPHPRSAKPEDVDAEHLMAELDRAGTEVAARPPLVELARLKERVESIADRAAWVTDPRHRELLSEKAVALLSKLDHQP
jgi:MoxR-like ATPase